MKFCGIYAEGKRGCKAQLPGVTKTRVLPSQLGSGERKVRIIMARLTKSILRDFLHDALPDSEMATSKRPWQRHNTMKLDGIREEIDNLKLPEVERCVALTSLILAMDKVDINFASHFSFS